MEKTRPLIAKTLTAILILFAFSAPFMSSASAIYKPATNSLPASMVFLTPSRINGTTVGETVNVYANVTNVIDLDTIQIGLAWSNTTVCNCTGVALGNIYNSIDGNYLTVTGTVNNVAGTITPYAWAATGTYNVNGSGTLAVFTFNIKHTGYSDVHITGMFLENLTGFIIPTTTVDCFTVRRGGQQYSVKVQGNPSQSAAVPPHLCGFCKENVTQMSAQTIGGVSGLVGNMTFAINATSSDNGAFCYFNATIPNNLMNCSGNNDKWIVQVDGALESARTVLPGATTTTISLQGDFYPSGEYGTTVINIYSTNVAVPEFASMFSSVLLATLLALATLAAALFFKTMPHRKQKG